MLRRTALSTLGGILALPRLSLKALADKFASAPAPAQTEEDFTIRTTSRLVSLDVSVKGPKGGFVTGLNKKSFKVYENGKLQEITQFANADIPVTVGIVVDESGSMAPKRGDVITAALAFIGGATLRTKYLSLISTRKPTAAFPMTCPFQTT